LRQHLADDLDTPKALAAIDAWAKDSLDGLGNVSSAPADLSAAVDALLGVPLVGNRSAGS
jgi:L-cysteine:1D-myo-inositol 2-amino-2-deoxy-alpha-D-glucopyranoside ligase